MVLAGFSLLRYSWTSAIRVARRQSFNLFEEFAHFRVDHVLTIKGEYHFRWFSRRLRHRLLNFLHVQREERLHLLILRQNVSNTVAVGPFDELLHVDWGAVPWMPLQRRKFEDRWWRWQVWRRRRRT